MKKFAAVLFFTVLALSLSFAATDDTTITASVAQQLTVTASDLDLGEITYSTGDTGDITINARSNLKSWKMYATAQYGALTWGGDTAWTTADTNTQISYTVTLKSGESTLFGASGLTAATQTEMEAFTRKTTGGSSGENFTLTVTVPTSAEDLIYGVYKEVITITVSAT
jgi:hypothetical protein